MSKQSRTGAPALRGVSLGVARGEICALCGPPGSGKSTLLRVLATACRADAGSFCLAGHLVTSYPWRRAPLAAVRRAAGYLPAAPGHFTELTGAESLWLYARAHGLPAAEGRRRAGLLLEWARLSHLAQQPVGTYTDAQQRRLALVQALVHRPQVLLLDDPGQGQDPGFRQALGDLLAQWAAGGAAVLLAAATPTGPEFGACHRHLRLEGGRLV